MLKRLLLILPFLFLPGPVFAASGSQQAVGGVIYVEGEAGIVGWAAEPNGQPVAQVDYYLTKRSEPIGSGTVCTRGNLSGGKTVAQINTEVPERLQGHNGQLFAETDDCLRNLPDGDYDLYVGVGPYRFIVPPFQFSVATDPNTGFRFWAHYLGILISRRANDYDTYPSAMKDGNVFKMWYGSGNMVGHPGDNVFYAESRDGINWNLIQGPLEDGAVFVQSFNDCRCSQNGEPSSCPVGQNFVLDDMHVADPSVVKVNGVYYMYYTAASKRWACFGTNNHIGLATSTDGVHWRRYTDQNGLPKAVLSPERQCTDLATCGPWMAGYPYFYGAGMPSLVYRDFDGSGQKKFMNFYTDMSGDRLAWSLATGSDGQNFNQIEYGLAGDATFGVKYSQYLQNYIAVNAQPVAPGNPGLVMFFLSPDAHKNTWKEIEKFKIAPNFSGDNIPRKTIFTMDEFTVDPNHWVINNGDFLSSPEGVVGGRNTILYMGAGKGMQPLESTWDMVGVDLWLTKTGSGNCSLCPVGKPARSLGNANCDSQIDPLDYTIWVKEYGQSRDVNGKPITKSDWRADFNCDSQVSGLDFNVLLRNAVWE